MPDSSPPPPPGPAPDRPSRPDRAAHLAERAEALRELVPSYLARRRALLLWLAAGLIAVGWAAIWVGCRYVAMGDVVSVVLGVFCLALAVGLVVPSTLAVASGVREDLEARERLLAWAGSARDRDSLARWHSPGRALFWLLPSLVLCCFGSASAAMAAVDGSARALGFALLAGGTGALGMAKAVGYYRLVSRELTVSKD
ncbi:hypothetical protein [Streptomyces sp. ME19-01-6]|uniref:hypothetical protein n=1 Tax=Streptomyces sp. ME19-01-6 TaxID=3028686 RepID=UPI00299FBDA5|nr:hypothetical protein [Streptomyces sp. ME19-01-6]MDX3226424.1 hypothetical protein [Streptomyces sp. ME19-01-6]